VIELNTKLLAFIFLNSRNHGGNTKRTAHWAHREI